MKLTVISSVLPASTKQKNDPERHQKITFSAEICPSAKSNTKKPKPLSNITKLVHSIFLNSKRVHNKFDDISICTF